MDRMASIEMALKNETTERDFYLNEARRSKNEIARTMFEMLAKDEEEHMRRIRDLHEKLVGEGNWPADVPIDVAGTNVKQTLDGLLGKAGSQAEHDDDDIAALTKAIAFEAKGADLYAKLAEASENPMEKNFFAFLHEIEQEHQLSLTDALEYLQDPQDYFLRHERAGLDGA